MWLVCELVVWPQIKVATNKPNNSPQHSALVKGINGAIKPQDTPLLTQIGLLELRSHSFHLKAIEDANIQKV